MSRTFKKSILILVIVVVGLGSYVSLDVSTVNARRSKAAELSRLAAKFEKSHMSAVLAEFGSPSRVGLETIRDRDATATRRHQLIFTYQYAFGKIPWRYKQRVWITFRFNEHLQVTEAWVDQTHG